MSMARILSRASKSALLLHKSSPISPSSPISSPSLFVNRFHSLSAPPKQISVLQHLLNSNSAFQRSRFSSSASTEHNEKKEQGINVEDKGDDGETKIEDAASSDQKQGLDMEGDTEDLSKDDLVKLVIEKEAILEEKQKEVAAMKDKCLRIYAESENVMDRARREAENSKKFAIQSFAKGLLDVADNLGRASSVVKENFAKLDVSQDASEAVPLLKTLLEGVEMTDKQLLEVFRKFGVDKYDPINEQFDPNRHNAVFQVPDDSKPEGTIAVVLKPGYTLHGRIIRPAEVGVTQGGGEAN